MRNDAGTCQEKWHETDTLRSGDVHGAKENPGALAGATGTDLGNILNCPDHYAYAARAASLLAQVLAFCPPDYRVSLLEWAIDRFRPGFPPALLIDAMRECREYAADLPAAYRKAMCLACYELMPAAVKQAFAAHITGANHG